MNRAYRRSRQGATVGVVRGPPGPGGLTEVVRRRFLGASVPVPAVPLTSRHNRVPLSAPGSGLGALEPASRVRGRS